MKQDKIINKSNQIRTNWFDFDLIKTDELSQVSELLKFIWRETFSDFLSELPANILFCPEKIKEWVDAANTYTLVAKTQDNKIVGIISAYHEQNRVHVSNLYIHPNFQKQGLGTVLLSSVFQQFPNVIKFTLRVFEKNIKARNFYLKQGFREVSVRNAIFGTEITPSILMEKIIN